MTERNMIETNSLIMESNDTGQFCWEVIDHIAVPFIIRPPGEMFVELNMLKKTLLSKERQVLSDDIFDIACPNMQLLCEVTDAEIELLDEINFQYCNNYFTNKPHSKMSNFLMKKSDAIELYQLLRVFTDIALNKKLETSKCGFLKIDTSETPVPFVDVEDVGILVPLFFFECPSVTEVSFPLNDFWPLTYLKLCCKLLTILPDFYDYMSLRVVNVDSLQTVTFDINQLSIFGSLPSQVKLSGFLRSDSARLRFHTLAKNSTASNLQTINKRHFEQTKSNDSYVSMAKKPKLRHGHSSDHTITISDSSEDDEFVEEKPKIRIEANELNTSLKETCVFNNFKEFEKPHADAAKIPSIKMGQSTKGVTQLTKSLGKKAKTTKRYIMPQVASSAVATSIRSPVLGTRTSHNPTVSKSTENMSLQPIASVMQKPRINTESLGMSTNIPTVTVQKQQSRSVVNVPGVPMQQSMQIFHQPGTLIQQPGTVIVAPSHLIPGSHTMMHQPNITVSTENILNQQGNVTYSCKCLSAVSNILNGPSLNQQGNVTNSCKCLSAVSNILNGPHSPMQQAEVNGKNLPEVATSAGLKSSEPQSIRSKLEHITGEDSGDLKKIKYKRVKISPVDPKKLKSISGSADDSLEVNFSAGGRFIKIAPLVDKEKLKPISSSALDSLADNSLAGNNVGNNALITQLSNNPPPFPGLTTSASNSNNMLILQPNNVGHSTIMTQATGEFAQSTAFMGLPTQNSVITPIISPSGVLTYHSGFMGNAAPLSLIQNSGQLLTNQSGFVINHNPVVTTSDVILTSAQNISNSQNIAAFSNGIGPTIDPIPNSLQNADEVMVTTQRSRLNFYKKEEVLYKVYEIPSFRFKGPTTVYYKVVKLKFEKCHTFMCVSKNPMDHHNLLISVFEIVEKLFPEISRKTFMTIATEMKLKIYALNAEQKMVLRRFYSAGGATDVTCHLYFLYNKFNPVYKIIKQMVFQRCKDMALLLK